jgi:putative ABC transport system substrate-binding protein
MVLARRRGCRRLVGIGLGLAGLGALAGCGVLPFQARSAGRVHRLGYLRAETPPPGDIEGFRRGLREQGYVEGETVVVEYRWADGDLGRLRALATELVDLDVDVIVVSAPDATRVAKEATATTPIVMVLVADPVAFGFVDGLARPGGNATGFAYLLPELSGERLELLAQAVPGLSRVAVMWNAANAYKPLDLQEVQAVAGPSMIELLTFPVREPDEFDGAFDAAVRGGAGGLIALEDPFTIAHRARIVDLALRHRLPSWTRSCAEPVPPTCRSSGPPRSSSWSTSRPRTPSGSPARSQSSSRPPRSSSRSPSCLSLGGLILSAPRPHHGWRGRSRHRPLP